MMNVFTGQQTANGCCGRTLRLIAAAALVAGMGSLAGAQSPYSAYIPTAVPSATTTLYSGASAIAPGRVGVDKAGNAFYVGHVTGLPSTLYEIPASSPAVKVTTPTALLSGLGALNSNSAFVDTNGNLWVSNGNGAGAAIIEVPAAGGIPNVAAITSASGYGATGLALSSVTASCTSSSTTPCVWSASSISSSFSSLQVSDIYSDGAGNVYLADIADSVSNGSYNRVIRFTTSAPGAITVLADKLTSNSYAQITVAGDGKAYYCDSTAGNSSGGAVSVINNGALTTVGNTPTTTLTLLNASVRVAAATGVSADPWGNLVISGPKQISELPLEAGAINSVDEFLLLYATGSNSPVVTNNIAYGGSLDVHGNYYFATSTNVMLTEMGGHNFGRVNVGTEVTSAAPFFNITWDLPTQLNTSFVGTSSPNTISAANVAYLNSFPFSGTKNYFGNSGKSASTQGDFAQMYFQPTHAGLLTGALSPQGYANYYGATFKSTYDLYNNGAYLVQLQGTGIGPQTMFLPGTASKAVTLSQLYTAPTHTAKAVGFTPSGVAVDSFGNIFVSDTTNTSLDLDCLSSTSNTAQNYRAASAGNSGGYTNSYCLTDSFANTNGSYLTGYTFKVTANSVTSGVTFPANFTNPVDVVLDGANNAYVLDSGMGVPTVTLMPFGTMIPRVIVPSNATPGGIAFSKPQAIAIDGYANLYIADTGNNRIIQAHQYNSAYSENIVYVSSTTPFGGVMLSSPQGMGVDAAGDLFIADTGNRRIVEYSVTGVASVVSTTGTALVSPTSVKVLPSGALVVADNSLGLVLIDNGAASVLSTGAIALQSTQGLALDASGNIFVADPVGGQVVELNINSPAAASFPDTLKPDATGSHTSKETSYIYNDGTAALSFAASPTVTDNTSSATNEFSVDGNNTCTSGATFAPGANCNLILDFTPSSTAVVYTTVTGKAIVSDNQPAVTPVTNPASGSQAIGSFSTPGKQQVNLSANPVVPFTPQTITFPTPAAVTWTGSNQVITLNATGGPSGQPIVYTVVSGPGVLSTSGGVTTITVKDIGTTVVAANQAGALNNGVYYSAAPQVTVPVVVNPIGTIATPTFSVAGGTYTAVQSVTISDATPGATIYYTTNGNTPTTSSSVYTGQTFTVSVTTTIKAIAVGVPGYLNSAVATAVYTLPPDFLMKVYNTDLTIPNGTSGMTTITMTPLFAFSGQVTVSCTGLPAGDSCAFLDNKGSVNNVWTVPDPNPAIALYPYYGTLIVYPNETASLEMRSRILAPVTALAFVVFVGAFRKRRRLASLALVVLAAVGATMISGCSQATLTGKTHTSQFTVVATSGSVVHTQTITLNVDNLLKQ